MVKSRFKISDRYSEQYFLRQVYQTLSLDANWEQSTAIQVAKSESVSWD